MKVKICPRGHVNDDVAHVCWECSEPLDQVQPVEEDRLGAVGEGQADPAPVETRATMYLESPRQCGFLATVESEAVIGRGADVDVTDLDPDEIVSRRHARIFNEDGRWWVEHLSTVNPTFVAGVKLAPGRPVVLEDGDSLTLARLELLVRIRT